MSNQCRYNVKIHWSNPSCLCRPTALGLFTACKNLKFWINGEIYLHREQGGLGQIPTVNR